jgi:Diadenosine tetraphosphate (Ap4A) hydrolase and other HIT family hydrolases
MVMDPTIECDICNGNADSTFKRIEVWKNDTWRMTMSKYSDVRSFCYLEPRRHIESITDLDGIEAAELGTVLASLTSALKRVSTDPFIFLM